MFRFLLTILAFSIFLFGCAGAVPWNPQNYAGITKWKITPVEIGKEVKYKLYVVDGKEKQDVMVTAEKMPDGVIKVMYSAKGVEAFPGQAIRAEVEREVAKYFREVLPEITKAVIEALKPAVVGP